MAQESNNVNFKIDRVNLSEGQIILDIEVNERNVMLRLDEKLFNDWFTKGTNLYSWVQEYRDGDNDMDVSGETHINDWWQNMEVNDTEHKKALSEYIKQDGYIKGALIAQYWHDVILYSDLSHESLANALYMFQSLIRDMFATHTFYQLQKHAINYQYTKEIKIC